MAELICIVCPKGCHLRVDETTFAVTGNHCEKGAAYGSTELRNPTRTLTSTVKLQGGTLNRCPVRTSAPIPKAKMAEGMQALAEVSLTAPVTIGQIAVKDLLGTGADVIITRNIDAL